MGNRSWWRLATLMGLAYAVQGAWWPLLSVHLNGLGISGRGRGAIFATQAIASLLTPLWLGQIADRRVAAPRLLAAIYGLGAILMVVLATRLTTSLVPLFLLFLLYWLITAPATGLCNAVCLRNLENPAEQFGGVRLWGTAGWMMAGWLVAACLALQGHGLPRSGTFVMFAIGAVFSILLMISCWSLPPTLPLASGSRGRIFSEALDVIRRPGVGIVLTAAFGVSLTTPFINQGVPRYLEATGMPHSKIATAMTMGQMSEILGLIALPFVLRRLGSRWTMAVGISSWITYHLIYAIGPPLPLAIAAIGLNGPAIAFFHIAGPMYIDSKAPTDRRAGAQSLWLIATTGLGNLFGNFLAGEVMERSAQAWRVVFAVPTLIDVGFLVVFLLGFRISRAGKLGAAVMCQATPQESAV